MVRPGMILKDTKDGSGLLTVDGKQYSFLLDGMWQSNAAPKVGMPVEVTFDADGAPQRIEFPSAKEAAMPTVPEITRELESIDKSDNKEWNPERKSDEKQSIKHLKQCQPEFQPKI